MKNLVAALDEINRRPIGYDGLPYAAYAHPGEYSRLDPRILWAYEDADPLRYLQEEIELGEQYEPLPTEPILIKGRLVERGTVASRIIERAASRKLSSNLDKYLSDKSWGYRSGRSPELAMLQVRAAIRKGAHWALKTDVSAFFPSIDRSILEAQLTSFIPDTRLCQFLMNAVKPVILDVKTLRRWERIDGLPQGNGLSPCLSNLYVDPVDQACSHLAYFRFADDLLILGSSRQEVLEAQHLLETHFAHLKLQLNPAKTTICNLYHKSLIFLGYELRGGNPYPPKKAILKLQHKLQFRGQSARREMMESFARRYGMGPVRKLFRRIDRVSHQWYPKGITLTGIHDAHQRRGCNNNLPGSPMGTAENERQRKSSKEGRPPLPTQPGAGIRKNSCSVPNRSEK
jgi:hypothetical protein